MSAWTDHHAFPPRFRITSKDRQGRPDKGRRLGFKVSNGHTGRAKTPASEGPQEVRDPHAAETAQKEAKPLPAMEKAASVDATWRISPSHSARPTRAVAL